VPGARFVEWDRGMPPPRGGLRGCEGASTRGRLRLQHMAARHAQQGRTHNRLWRRLRRLPFLTACWRAQLHAFPMQPPYTC
jgi:hypothetical protein